MRWAVLVFCLLGASCLSACATNEPASAPAPEAGAIARGAQIASIHCAHCHAIGEAGESTHPTAPAFRTLSRNYPVTALEEAFAEGILVGHPDMPQFRFEPAEIADLLAYIQSIQPQRAG